jgi:Flp pilus assembly protein protease CpaA
MTSTILALTNSSPVESIPAWIWLLVVGAGVIASITDLRHTRIPNWLTLPLFAGGLLYAGIHSGIPGLGQALAGAATAGTVPLLGYIMLAGGAGDAKLMMAFGTWLGFEASIVLMVGVAVTGFIQAMVVVVSRGGLRDIPLSLVHSLLIVRFAARQALRGKFIGPPESPETEAQPARNEAPQPRPQGWVPYAPAILTGTLAAWWYWTNYGVKR